MINAAGGLGFKVKKRFLSPASLEAPPSRFIASARRHRGHREICLSFRPETDFSLPLPLVGEGWGEGEPVDFADFVTLPPTPLGPVGPPIKGGGEIWAFPDGIYYRIKDYFKGYVFQNFSSFSLRPRVNEVNGRETAFLF